MFDQDGPDAQNAERPSPEEQLEETRHKLQRLAADFDNFRKRTHREKEDLQTHALRRFLLSLLPVIDDLERAVGHLESESPRPTTDEPNGTAAGTTAGGFRMIAGRVQQVLEAEGVRRYRSQGERFTPRLHEAVDHVYDDRVPAGHVIREMATGYDYGDDVLRPARVVVSKGAEGDAILFEFDIEEEETTEPDRDIPEGL